jgi:hypothetical protein
MEGPEMTDERINVAFRNLRKRGYFARQNFWCCQTCAWYAIGEDHPDKVDRAVFYHQQDAATLKRDGGTMLAWSGDGHEIVKTCLEAGLAVEWDGTENTRIFIGTQSPAGA